MSLTVKRAEVIDENTVDLTFTEDDGSEVTFRFAKEGPAGSINGDRAFGQSYRQVPGPAAPMWPEQVVKQLLSARNEPFLSGDDLVRRKEEHRHALEESWNNRWDDEQY